MFVTVTDAALEVLLLASKREEHPSDQAMRVIWDGDDYAFKLDTPDIDDLIFRQDGESVLLISPRINERLRDMKMDVVTKDGKNSFVMFRVD